MPVIHIQTNQNQTVEPALLSRCSSAIARMLGKPEAYVMVIVRNDLAMSFAGTQDPCAYVELKSLGLPENQTTEFSRQICTLVAELFGVDPARTYIAFSSPERHLFGWNNATF